MAIDDTRNNPGQGVGQGQDQGKHLGHEKQGQAIQQIKEDLHRRIKPDPQR